MSRTAVVLLALVATPPQPVAAQASREGVTFTASGASPGFGVRRPDVAFDPANQVYLVVSGPMTHGRFVNSDGVPLGAGTNRDESPEARFAIGTRRCLVGNVPASSTTSTKSLS